MTDFKTRGSLTAGDNFLGEDMLSIRDLDTSPKFAPLLCILLLTTALMVHLELLDEHYMPSAQGVVYALDGSVLANWALKNASETIQIIGWGLVLAGLLCFILESAQK